ncbi:MAG TPA: hypothetical protein VLX29_06835 [Nitrospirota bacterium]|nr:hypothetical protein [Nitrospirota bacterium]
MASVKDRKLDNYCYSIDKELSQMEREIDVLREDLNKEYWLEGDVLRTSEQHLIELKDCVDSKRQLLMKDCPIHPNDEDDLLFIPLM